MRKGVEQVILIGDENCLRYGEVIFDSLENKSPFVVNETKLLDRFNKDCTWKLSASHRNVEDFFAGGNEQVNLFSVMMVLSALIKADVRWRGGGTRKFFVMALLGSDKCPHKLSAMKTV